MNKKVIWFVEFYILLYILSVIEINSNIIFYYSGSWFFGNNQRNLYVSENLAGFSTLMEYHGGS